MNFITLVNGKHESIIISYKLFLLEIYKENGYYSTYYINWKQINTLNTIIKQHSQNWLLLFKLEKSIFFRFIAANFTTATVILMGVDFIKM